MSGTITKGGTIINCALIKGQFAPKQMSLREWRVPGFDGKSYQQTGTAPIETTVEAFFLGTQVDYITWRDAIFALGGEVVVIANSDGFTSGNVIIKGFGQPVVKSGQPNYAVKAILNITVESC